MATGQIITILHIFMAIAALPFHMLWALLTAIFDRRKVELRDKIVLVTGAGNGIGRELTIQLVRFGCKVLCVDMKQEDLEETITIVTEEQKSTDCVKSYVCDISDFNAVNKIRDEILATYGSIDILFNNAGISYESILDKCNESNIKRVVDVNILGNIWVTRAFLPRMKQTGKGHITFVSSLSALSHDRQMPIYSLTKCALTGLALSLEDEMSRNKQFENIGISLAYPYFVKSNKLISSFIRPRWPALEVATAARQIIEGTRRKLPEFSVPGYEIGINLMKLTKVLPWKSYKMFQKTFAFDMATLDDQNSYAEMMSTKSCKLYEDRCIAEMKHHVVL